MSISSPDRRPFVPALGLHGLTGFYDHLIARFLDEQAWKSRLVAAIAVRAGDLVVDVGSGTGTLAILLAQACTEATVIGIDPDPVQIRRATAKARSVGLSIRFEQAIAESLPLGDDQASVVVSSLMLHHLQRSTKRAALAEAHRILRIGGRLVIADWAKPDDRLMRLAFLPVQVFDGFPNTEDNRLGLLTGLAREAGFDDVREVYRRRTILGNLAFLVATRRDRAPPRFT